MNDIDNDHETIKDLKIQSEMKMVEKLGRLKIARELETKYRAERDKLIQDLGVVRLLESIKQQREELENEIREEAINRFKETGEKKFGQVGIRLTKNLVYEFEQAMIWAIENMPIAIKTILDKKQFETFAKVNDLDFVEIEEIPTATIPVEIKEEYEKDKD